MVLLYGGEAYNHDLENSISKLPFDLKISKVINHTYNYYNAGIGGKYIVVTDNGDYYYMTWTVTKYRLSRTVRYNLFKIDFYLFYRYIMNEISYSYLFFECLKKNNTYYKVDFLSKCFDNITAEKIINKSLKYEKVYKYSFDTTNGIHLIIPYEYKDIYEPIGFKCEDEPYSESSYKMYNKLNTHYDDSLINFIKREYKINSLL